MMQSRQSADASQNKASKTFDVSHAYSLQQATCRVRLEEKMCTIGGGDHVIAIPKLIWGHAYMGLYQWVIEGQRK